MKGVEAVDDARDAVERDALEPNFADELGGAHLGCLRASSLSCSNAVKNGERIGRVEGECCSSLFRS